MKILSTLFAARDSIYEGRFDFYRWNTCTVSHIYAGVYGHLPESVPEYMEAERSSSVYADAITSIATVLGWDGSGTFIHSATNAARYISDLTAAARGGALRTVDRGDGIHVIEDAICAVQRQEAEIELVITVDGNAVGSLQFINPYGADLKQFAEELVRKELGEEHVADLDWDHCLIVDD